MFRLPSLSLSMTLLLWTSIVCGADEGRIAYGDSTAFWESHALVVAAFRDPELKELLVQECVPPRYPAGTRVHLIDASKNMKISLDEYVDEHSKEVFRKKDARILCIVREVKGVIRMEYAVPLRGSDIPLLFLSAGSYDSYAMFPCEMSGGADDNAVISRTVRLCDALATGSPLAKVKKLEVILADGPNDREKKVIKRALTTAVSEWKSALTKAKTLSSPD